MNDIWIWKDSGDMDHKLLTRGKFLPAGAPACGKGIKLVNAPAPRWILMRMLDEKLTATDVRLGLDSQSALADLERQGFHEFRAGWHVVS